MLGIDIGTTNVKAALYSYAGTEVLVASTSYPLQTDEEGAAIQDATEIKEGVFQVIQEVTAECHKRNWEITFISFSAAMHSLLEVDKEGQAITPLLTWGDRRAESYVQQVKEESRRDIYQRTGTPIHPMSPFVKLLWLQAEHPEVIENAHRLVGIKSYILYQFLNEYYTDYSIANATGLFNMENLAWDPEILEFVELSETKLPQIVPTTRWFTASNKELLTELGLSSNVKLVMGASDGCLSNLGANALKPGSIALTIGTSGAIRSVVDRPLTDVKERTFCYALTENHWVVGGPVNNGGIVLDWARANFHVEDYETLMQQIETIQPGANNLFFHPYLVGERAPIWQTEVRGSFYGLTLHHQNEHLLRAVLEGINFNLYAVYQAITDVIGDQTKEISVTGGFTKSTTWLQMLADIFGLQINVMNVTENACFGAVLLGLLATDEIKDFSEVSEMISITQCYTPHAENHAFYQEHFKKYQKLNAYILEMSKVL